LDLLDWRIAEAAPIQLGSHQFAHMNAAEVKKLPIQDGHTGSLFAVQTGSWNNIVPCTGLFSYTGGGAFCCAGNSSYDVTCCNNAFTFSQSDIGRPFMPGFVNASTITTGTASTVTSTALSTVTALSGGVSAQTVGLALGLPLGLIAIAACVTAAFLYRKSQGIHTRSQYTKESKLDGGYFQPKPELGADQPKPKQELTGDQPRHELH
jgi:hypothetical protein